MNNGNMPEQHLGAHIGGSVPTNEELGISHPIPGASKLRTRLIVVNSELDALAAAAMFIGKSKWFEMTPLPDDQWEFKIKDE